MNHKTFSFSPKGYNNILLLRIVKVNEELNICKSPTQMGIGVKSITD